MGFLSFASANDIDQVRKSFHQAVLEPTNITAFHQYVNSLSENAPVIVAYKAMSEALMAQQVWNPIDKYVCIKKFESLINLAADQDPGNLEIRFLRICIEYYIPEWLPISNHLEADKIFILQNIPMIRNLVFDQEFVRYISSFLKEPGMFTKEQAALIDLEFAMSNQHSSIDNPKISG